MHQRAGDLGNILEKVLLLTERLTMNDNVYLSIDNSGLSLALSGTHVGFDLSTWPITCFSVVSGGNIHLPGPIRDLPQVSHLIPGCWELPFHPFLAISCW